MSKTIDEKVVSMQFDNKDFEKNVQTTLSTIDKLKRSLNLAGASKGLENVGSAAKKIDLSGISSAAETVRSKFSALEVMGVTALANITNSAVNAGKRIVSALTIDPIKTGFNEYETKINAIQTIMSNTASKGTTMDDVTRVIGDLNTYADKTIYNFAEMTRNIGTFTAAGVGLEDSASAIKGIANLAAASGSNSQQASTAMYQLSQALAAGSVKLMDWNSVVNAGMGGEKFQEALKATARDHGVAVDSIIKKNGSFRESLQEGWITADILNETLNKFTVDGAKNYGKSMVESGKWTQAQADALVKEAQAMEDAATKVKTFTQLWDTLKESAQSGWSQTWEILVGDFEEAKETLTEISDVIGKMIGASADARNELLQGWKDAGGRSDLIDGLWNAFNGIMNIVKPIKEAFREIFPPLTVDQLVKFTEGFKNLTQRFEDFTSKHGPQIKSTFKGIFAVVDIIVTVFKDLAGGAIDLLGNLTGLGGGILGITGSFGDWLSGMRDTVKETDYVGKAVDKIVNFLQKAIDKIKEFSGFLKEKLVMPGWEGFLIVMQAIWDVITKVGRKIADVASGIGEALVGVFRSGDLNTGLDLINGGIFTAILLGIKKFIGGISDAFEDAGGLLEGVKGILDGVKDSLEAWQTNLKAGALLKIASAIALLAASIVVISMIDPAKLSASLGAITVLFSDLMASMFVFNKIGGDYKNTTKAVTAMIGVSTAVLILASALKKIASLEVGDLAKGLVGIAGLTAVVVGAAKAMSSDTGKVMKGATSLVIFAAAIKVLASACKDLSSLSWNELAKGLVGVGILMAEVSLFLNTAKFGGKALSTATGIVIMAAAIKILASACADFGDMNWGQIGKGLTSIGALLAEIAIFTKLTGNAKHVVSTGVALVTIGAAMKIFASAVEDFSGMSWEEIGRGLTAMAGALAAVTLAVNLMPKNMAGVSVGMVVISSALLILAEALGKMGGMSWEEIGKGLATLGGSIVILAAGLFAMNGSLAGSAALIIAAGALAILTPVLTTLGGMSWESIAKGLLTIAGAFTIIGVAGLVLGPVIPAILGLAGAIALLGVGVLTTGAGIAVLAAGITALSTALAAGATAITAGLVVIVSGILGLIPLAIQKLGEGIVLLCKVIGESATEIGAALTAVLLAAIDMLVQCVPQLAEGLFKIFAGCLSALAEYTPQIVNSLFQFLIGILNGVAENLPDLIQAAVNVLVAFFQGVVDALKGIDVTALLNGIVAVGLLSGLMLALSAIAALVPAAMVGVLGMGVLIAELALVLAAIGAFAQIPGLSWLIEEGGEFLGKIGKAIGQFIGGIAGGALEGVTSAFPQMGQDLADFMTNVQPFIDGARNIDASVLEGVKSLAGVVLALTAANIVERLTSWLTGGTSLADFGKELAEFGPYMAKYAKSVAGINPETVTASANAAKALSEMAAAIPNTGGLVSFFSGENDMTTFGTQIVAFGKNLKKYGSAVEGINAEAITASVTAGKELAKMASAIPNLGGMVSWFTGDNDLATFGTKLVSFGKSLKKYSGSVVGIDSEAISASVKATKSLSKMASAIPNMGGVVSWFTGDNNLSSFGTNLVSFGKSLKNYSEKVSGIDTGALSSSTSEFKKLVNMAKGMSGVDFDGLSSFANALGKIGKNSVKKFIEAFEDGSSKASKAFKELADSMKKAAESKYSEFTKMGKNIATKFADGINDAKNKAGKAFTSTLAHALTSIRGKYNSFYNAGSYLVTGFANGISENTYKAKAKAKAMAKAAADAAKKELDEHSPSRVGYEIGDYFGIAFVNALRDYASVAYAASSEMAGAARNGLREAILKINDYIGDDMNAQPTIRPVLDLSEVAAGAGRIGGMFNMRPSVGVLSSVGSINSMMKERVQNGNNSDIITAINKLRKDLSNTKGNTYNVNGVTYDDGSNIANAVESIVRAAIRERRT